MKTTLSNEIMNQIADLVENELRSKRLFYNRYGTNFRVPGDNIPDLLEAQENATKKLVNDGIITKEMIEKDINANFK